MNNQPIRVALLDENLMTMERLKEILEEQDTPSYEVVLTASKGQELIQQLYDLEEPVDFLIIDMGSKRVNGISVLEEFRINDSNLKFIVIASDFITYNANIFHMINFGAHAFLPKEIDKKELLEVLREVQQKGHYLSPEQAEILKQQINPKEKPKPAPKLKELFNPRELEVLKLIAQQKSTKEIAQELFLSPKTIEVHKSNLLSKAGVRNMAGLIMFAIENELIDPDDLILLG